MEINYGTGKIAKKPKTKKEKAIDKIFKKMGYTHHRSIYEEISGKVTTDTIDYTKNYTSGISIDKLNHTYHTYNNDLSYESEKIDIATHNEISKVLKILETKDDDL
jgi:hypothetical protein